MPSGVYLRTEKHRKALKVKRKRAKGLKRIAYTTERKEMMKEVALKNSFGKWMKGKKHSHKTLSKITEAQRSGRFAYKHGLSNDKYYLSWLKNKRNRILSIQGEHHTYEEWLEVLKIFDNSCAFCKSRTRIEKDHIIPVSKGGKDTIDNIQPLCKICNIKKYNKILK